MNPLLFSEFCVDQCSQQTLQCNYRQMQNVSFLLWYNVYSNFTFMCPVNGSCKFHSSVVSVLIIVYYFCTEDFLKSFPQFIATKPEQIMQSVQGLTN